MPKLTESCISEIKRAEPIADYLTPAAGHPKEYGCPFCGSSHHVKIFDDNTATCMRCREEFDLFKIKKEKEGLDFLEAARDIAERHNIRLETEDGTEFSPPEGWTGWTKKHKEAEEKTEDLVIDPPEAPKNTPGKYAEDIAKWTAAGDPAREYMKTRGPFTDSFLDIYEIGYKITYFDKAKKELPAVVFSYNFDHSYYGARSLDDKYFAKPPAKCAGPEPLFRPEQLKEKDPCFVVESQIDALAIIQSGAPAVALCGTGFEKLIPEIKDRKTPLILFLDNDPNGRAGQTRLKDDLTKRKTPFREARFDLSKYTGPKKDAADLFKANPEQFKKDLSANIAAALDPIDSFLFETRTEKYKPIPTGIKSIDKMLYGGFMPGTLILVGSPPGGGKTALCSQIMESIAENGRPGIYINMEMAQEQLIARSFARRVYINNHNYELTALNILQGYSLSETSQQLVQKAAEEYKAKVGRRLLYNPGAGPDLDEIIKYINDMAEEAQREGKQVANICIDYLHLLTGKPGEDTASILKRAVFAFKEYAIKYNAVVICIEAQNREANQKKAAVLEAGRDSSGLEYGGDLILQLVAPDKEKPWEIDLCITKSRFTATNYKGFRYILHGAQSYMEAIEDSKTATDWRPIDPGESPFDDPVFD